MAALAFAIVLGIVLPRPVSAADCHPLCAIYDDPWHPLYWWYSCNTCAPPSPEG